MRYQRMLQHVITSATHTHHHVHAMNTRTPVCRRSFRELMLIGAYGTARYTHVQRLFLPLIFALQIVLAGFVRSE